MFWRVFHQFLSSVNGNVFCDTLPYLLKWTAVVHRRKGTQGMSTHYKPTHPKLYDKLMEGKDDVEACIKYRECKGIIRYLESSIND